VPVDESNVGSSVRIAGRGLDWLKLRDFLAGPNTGRDLIDMVVYAGLPPTEAGTMPGNAQDGGKRLNPSCSFRGSRRQRNNTLPGYKSGALKVSPSHRAAIYSRLQSKNSNGSLNSSHTEYTCLAGC
jgi:hypothetical protein